MIIKNASAEAQSAHFYGMENEKRAALQAAQHYHYIKLRNAGQWGKGKFSDLHKIHILKFV